jgi:hypothetical protein
MNKNFSFYSTKKKQEQTSIIHNTIRYTRYRSTIILNRYQTISSTRRRKKTSSIIYNKNPIHTNVRIVHNDSTEDYFSNYYSYSTLDLILQYIQYEYVHVDHNYNMFLKIIFNTKNSLAF